MSSLVYKFVAALGRVWKADIDAQGRVVFESAGVADCGVKVENCFRFSASSRTTYAQYLASPPSPNLYQVRTFSQWG